MTAAESRRRMVVVGTNPRTGSPLKVRKYNKPKAKSSAATGSAATKSPLSRMKNAFAKRKGKAGREDKSSLMCNGVPISLAELSSPQNFPISPRESQASPQPDVLMSNSAPDIDINNDIQIASLDADVEVTGNGDAHHAIWLQQLPKFEGSQRHRRSHAWPRWRDDVLNTIVPFFLQAEAMIYDRAPLPKLASSNHPDTLAECAHTHTSTVVQCIERTGMLNTLLIQ
ncbi:MAG TPA: hypothetical protein VGO47_06070 [Chlamydiales bacterium]|nr:hypothetical protein [Chlamydiales bacterium]